ncbi:hypothetical protein ACEQPO_30035 [Bacillus sp. SL00103]
MNILPTYQKSPGRQKTSDYEELLEFVGLDHYHQEKVGSFTPGMKKRLGMAPGYRPST